MELNLKVESQEFKLIWDALGEAPARAVFMLLTKLKAQVEAQEAAAREPKTSEAAQGQARSNDDGAASPLPGIVPELLQRVADLPGDLVKTVL